ncbi:MAG: hypothetical protein ABI051_10255 [Vicinamibacterales bacterium]
MAGGNPGQLAPLIRQAITSDGPLPVNPVATALLKARAAAAAAAPAPTPIGAMPSLAATISGKVFKFPVNTSRLDSLALTFAKEGSARVDLTYYGEPLSVPIGLDGVYRTGPHGPFRLPAGATGKWTSDTEFLLGLNFIANINHYTLAIRFTPEQTIAVTVNEASGLMRNGQLVGTPSL